MSKTNKNRPRDEDENDPFDGLFNGPIGAFLGFLAQHMMMSPGDEAAYRAGHNQHHQEKIHHWEHCLSEVLSQRFGEMVKADLIELQRMSYRACTQGKSDVAAMLSLTSELIELGINDPRAMPTAIELLRQLVGQIQAIHERVEKARETEAKTKAEVAKRKARETRARAAQARTDRAEAEAKERKEQAERN